MRFVDEFRDPELGRTLAGEILATVHAGRHYKICLLYTSPSPRDS